MPTNGRGALVGMSRLPSARLLISFILLAPAILRAQPANLTEENRHTDARSRFVHRINLRAENGTPITLEKPEPYSPMATCAACHPTNLISHGWHFNYIDQSVNPGRPGEPWIYIDATTRTQIPLSYRKW